MARKDIKVRSSGGGEFDCYLVTPEGDHVFLEERTVDVHIRRLRKALEPSSHDRLIETVRSAGYRFARAA